MVHELIERFEAHLTAGSYFSVVANMRGDSAEAVAAAILSCEGLGGLQVRQRLGLRCLSQTSRVVIGVARESSRGTLQGLGFGSVPRISLLPVHWDVLASSCVQQYRR